MTNVLAQSLVRISTKGKVFNTRRESTNYLTFIVYLNEKLNSPEGDPRCERFTTYQWIVLWKTIFFLFAPPDIKKRFISLGVSLSGGRRVYYFSIWPPLYLLCVNKIESRISFTVGVKSGVLRRDLPFSRLYWGVNEWKLNDIADNGRARDGLRYWAVFWKYRMFIAYELNSLLTLILLYIANV